MGAREKVSTLSLQRASVRMSSCFLTHPKMKYSYLVTLLYIILCGYFTSAFFFNCINTKSW